MADERLILIVDDDYDFLEINRRILERAGFRVVTAGSPSQAMDKVEAETPDLVITDLMMSEVDSGFSLSKRLRDDPRTRPCRSSCRRRSPPRWASTSRRTRRPTSPP